MTPEQELEQLRLDAKFRKQSDDDRKVSDDKYAAKVIEKIVIGFLTVLSLGVIGFIGKLIISAIYHLPQ